MNTLISLYTSSYWESGRVNEATQDLSESVKILQEIEGFLEVKQEKSCEDWNEFFHFLNEKKSAIINCKISNQNLNSTELLIKAYQNYFQKHSEDLIFTVVNRKERKTITADQIKIPVKYIPLPPSSFWEVDSIDSFLKQKPEAIHVDLPLNIFQKQNENVQFEAFESGELKILTTDKIFEDVESFELLKVIDSYIPIEQLSCNLKRDTKLIESFYSFIKEKNQKAPLLDLTLRSICQDEDIAWFKGVKYVYTLEKMSLDSQVLSKFKVSQESSHSEIMSPFDLSDYQLSRFEEFLTNLKTFSIESQFITQIPEKISQALLSFTATNCTELKEINLIKAEKVSINNCPKLEKLSVEKVEKLAILGNSSITSAYIPKEAEKIIVPETLLYEGQKPYLEEVSSDDEVS